MTRRDLLRGKEVDSAVQLMTKLWLILGPILPEGQRFNPASSAKVSPIVHLLIFP